MAYERKGNTAEAMLATARKLFYSGSAKDIREAQIYAKRAAADLHARIARLAHCRGHRDIQDPRLSQQPESQTPDPNGRNASCP